MQLILPGKTWKYFIAIIDWNLESLIENNYYISSKPNNFK